MVCFVGGKKIDTEGKKLPQKTSENTGENAQKNKGKIIVFATLDEAEAALAQLGLPADSAGTRQATHFESRYEGDYTFLKVPDFRDGPGKHAHADLYLTTAGLLVMHDGLPTADQLLRELEAWPGDFPEPDRILTLLLTRLTAGDGEMLADIEEEIITLEEQVMAEKTENYTGQINKLRKRLMVLHRYYEGLFEALEDMEENENGLLGKVQMKNLHMQTNRTDRYTRAVSNLRDYVTQVREAYQNELDISLNKTMKLFTVITAIFLPLTLIAGWYGMNLKMPEYELATAYPVIILVSLAVVIACIWYFKRHKWF